MRRQATLYTVKSELVQATDDRVVIMNAQMSGAVSSFVRGSRESLIHYERTDVPVDYVCKIENGEKREHYIAIHPELREILEAPFINEFDNWRSGLQKEIDFRNQLIVKLKSRIDGFCELPWYRRVWLAITRRIP